MVFVLPVPALGLGLGQGLGLGLGLRSGRFVHLGGLRLTGARGPRRRASQRQVHGAHQSHVAPIRQRRDHQPRTVAQILVAAGRVGVGRLG